MTTPLYQEIAESIRQAIFYEELTPGDELPPVRDMSAQWQCAPGTVQRAYRELARQGLVVGRPGQGTRVAASPELETRDPLRRAALAHEAEAFLLRLLSSGYTSDEVEQAVQLAFDRWRAIAVARQPAATDVIRFVGSHDPLIARIADRFKTQVPGTLMQISFAGSLGGLIALVKGQADLAGCHLWDEDTDTYNLPFVRRLLPGQPVALLTLAHRRLGLLVVPGNPLNIQGLRDLATPPVRYINRQAGAGTRVWLDAQLNRLGIRREHIAGYDHQVMTHTDVARVIAAGEADVGLGIEMVAQAFGLDFHFLTHERYDLIIPEAVWETDPIQRLARWLSGDESHVLFGEIVGYDKQGIGSVRWSGG